MSASIQVAIKVRPLIKREEDENLPIQWSVQDKCITPLDPELKKRGEGGFHFGKYNGFAFFSSNQRPEKKKITTQFALALGHSPVEREFRR